MKRLLAAVFLFVSCTSNSPARAAECPRGEVLAGIDAEGSPRCVVDAVGTTTTVVERVELPQCPAGQWLVAGDAGYRCDAPVELPSCAAGEGLVSTGSGYVCAPRTVPSCPAGQSLVSTGTGYACATRVEIPTCPVGEWLVSTGTSYACSPTPMPPSYAAGTGLALMGSTFSVDSAWLRGEVLPRDGGTITGNVTIDSNAPGGPGAQLALRNLGGGSNASVGLAFSTFNSVTPSARFDALDDNFSATLSFKTRAPGNASNNLVERMRIEGDGDVVALGPVRVPSVVATGTVAASAFTGSGASLSGVVKGRVARGIVRSDGTLASTGIGLTASRLAQGRYRVDFSPSFTDTPTVHITSQGALCFWSVEVLSNQRAEFICANPGGTATMDAQFLFTAIGGD